MLFLATTESTTSPECYRSRTKCQKGLPWYKQGGFLSGECGDWMEMDILEPLKQVLEGSMQLTTCTSVPGLHLSIFGFHDLYGTKASGILRSLPHLSSFVLQPVHLLLPPLGCHGEEVLRWC